MSKTYKNLTQLPFRARLTLGLLYLTGTALIITAGVLTSNAYIVLLCTVIEVGIIFHLLNRMA